MPMWRCPNCGTPQAETARCWVCRRSSTTCSTCRHFRASLSTTVGFCGLDRRRAPLTGREMRGCWQAAEQVAEPERPRSLEIIAGSTSRLRGFVPVEAPVAAETRAAEAETRAAEASVAAERVAAEARLQWADRPTLFGDAEG